MRRRLHTLSLINNVNGRLEAKVTFIHYPLEGQAAQTRESGVTEEKKRNTRGRPDRLPHSLPSRCFPLSTHRHTLSPPDSLLTFSYLQNPTHSPTPRWPSGATLTHLLTPTTLSSPPEPQDPHSLTFVPHDPRSITSFPPRGTLSSSRSPRPTLAHIQTLTRRTLFPSRLLRTHALSPPDPQRPPLRSHANSFPAHSTSHTSNSIRTPFPGKHPCRPVPK